MVSVTLPDRPKTGAPPGQVARPGTIGARLDACGGFGPGFDFMRLLLALGVVLWHCFPITRGDPSLIEATAFWLLVSSMVPMFFALSGYLVTASALRIPVGPYLANRAARIGPALAAVVLITSLIIGPLVTEMSLGDYLRDDQLRRYLLSMFGYVSFKLPGVFQGNPLSGIVNGSLWTVPHEILCYLMMAGLMLTGLVRHWWSQAAIFVLLFAMAFTAALVPRGILPAPVDALLHLNHFSQGSKIIPFFLAGAIVYHLRDRIPHDGRLALLCMAAILAIGAFGDPDWRKGPLLWLCMAAPMTYLVVWGGHIPLPKPNFLGGGDFSYGVYLWHFPILQLLVMAFGFTQWWLLGLVALAPVLVAGALSWHLIERPVLQWRKRYSKVGAQLAAEDKAKARTADVAAAPARAVPPAE